MSNEHQPLSNAERQRRWRQAHKKPTVEGFARMIERRLTAAQRQQLRERLGAAPPEWKGSAQEVLPFLKSLRQGIAERKEAARMVRKGRRWTPSMVLTLEAIELVDWIEAQLDQLPVTRNESAAPRAREKRLLA